MTFCWEIYNISFNYECALFVKRLKQRANKKCSFVEKKHSNTDICATEWREFLFCRDILSNCPTKFNLLSIPLPEMEPFWAAVSDVGYERGGEDVFSWYVFCSLSRSLHKCGAVVCYECYRCFAQIFPSTLRNTTCISTWLNL